VKIESYTKGAEYLLRILKALTTRKH